MQEKNDFVQLMKQWILQTDAQPVGKTEMATLACG